MVCFDASCRRSGRGSLKAPSAQNYKRIKNPPLNETGSRFLPTIYPIIFFFSAPDDYAQNSSASERACAPWGDPCRANQVRTWAAQGLYSRNPEGSYG